MTRLLRYRLGNVVSRLWNVLSTWSGNFMVPYTRRLYPWYDISIIDSSKKTPDQGVWVITQNTRNPSACFQLSVETINKLRVVYVGRNASKLKTGPVLESPCPRLNPEKITCERNQTKVLGHPFFFFSLNSNSNSNSPVHLSPVDESGCRRFRRLTAKHMASTRHDRITPHTPAEDSGEFPVHRSIYQLDS